MLESLDLTKTERSVLERYKGDPEGRSFLPVSDILRTHNRIEESLELLAAGLEKHPSFTVARVVLARELFNRGMVANAWQTLIDSPNALSDNALAQKLRIKLTILLEKTADFRATRDHMQSFRMMDTYISKLADTVALSGMARAKDMLIQDLRSKGVDPVLPETSGDAQNDSGIEPVSRDEELDVQSVHIGAPSEIEGYHVVPLNEIFGDGQDGGDQKLRQNEPFELDSTTMADIYTKQEHYSKALAMYKRLLRMTPNNDFLKNKVRELAQLEKDQKEKDLNVDPVMADQMEQIEILDKQYKFYEKILDRLD